MKVKYTTNSGTYTGILKKVTATQIHLITNSDGHIQKFNRQSGYAVNNDAWHIVIIDERMRLQIEDFVSKNGKKNKKDIYVYEKKE